ncbi:domain of Kin17 curved DNA-binding protein-domain-containing protein [Pisolithus orientalis]|uniref:domain of Kin17 curved DNA-binding protein-domain-containing protein n=1 Tax=Pisolithus orientalis TaxID=936130 RepID=UPI0022246AE1|nr:domain of Kin17 curved DNA-binding protein-domain-containing protein [Pisolithus orientalis]KAI6030442.1 domain of Kin17 curved DNA-binding protein-domain-containing protein [Pisolithus orientalis]
MPRAEVGTPKYLANKMKAKGLQRLRWYCQVCQKQCRDENGFKCHAQSEAHLRQMLVVGEHAGRHIADFSSQFQHDFVQLLSRRFGTKRVFANRVYQEFIQHKEHIHMNATRWVTLTEFVKHLGRTGIAHVDETDEGWWVAWIDSSPKALAKQAATLQKERATMSDEQRERILIADQIERAKEQEEAQGSRSESPPEEELGLKRDEGTEKVVLSLAPKSLKLDQSARSQPTGGGGLKLNGIKPDINPLKANPLKRPNPLRSAVTSKSAESSEKKRPVTALSAAERIILEEQERKRRRMDRESITA